MSVFFWETKEFARELRRGRSFEKYVNEQHGRPLRFFEQLCKEPVRLPPGHTDADLQGYIEIINRSIENYNQRAALHKMREEQLSRGVGNLTLEPIGPIATTEE